MDDKKPIKDFQKELIEFLKISNNSTIDEIIQRLSMEDISNPTNFNKIYQLLRKLKTAFPEKRQKIADFLHTIKKTKFKSFKIHIANAFYLDTFQGDVSLYLNNKCLVSQFVKNIRPTAFEQSIKGNVKEKQWALLTIGCGSEGCCQSLYWESRLDEEYIFINKICWWISDSHYDEYQEIDGEFKIKKADYESEVKRLKIIFEKCKDKSNKIPWKHPSHKFRKEHNLE